MKLKLPIRPQTSWFDLFFENIYKLLTTSRYRRDFWLHFFCWIKIAYKSAIKHARFLKMSTSEQMKFWEKGVEELKVSC